MSNEGSDEEHEHHDPIEEVGEHVEVVVVEHEDNHAQTEGTADPEQLLSGARVEREEVHLTETVAGPAHTDPPEGEQEQKDEQHPSVGTKSRVDVVGLRHK